MPTYTDNPYLTQCKSILSMTLICMLEPIQRHSTISIVKQLKYTKMKP